MSESDSSKLNPVYFPNLDALRFLAAFGVFVFHYFRDIRSFYPGIEENALFKVLLSISDKGTLGVNFFFVLSGFLITYLILHENQQTGSFSLNRFLIRRTLRIWPVYFIVVLIGFIIFPLLFNSYHTIHNPFMYLFFLANFDELYNGMRDSINFLSAPWSVAVEEQFYLFWGIALFILLPFRKIKLIWFIALLYIASLAFCFMHLEETRFFYYHTLCVCQDILAGALLGWAAFNRLAFVECLTALKPSQKMIIYFMGILICLLKTKLFIHSLIILERPVISLFFVFVVTDQALSAKPLFSLGRIQVLKIGRAHV